MPFKVFKYILKVKPTPTKEKDRQQTSKQDTTKQASPAHKTIKFTFIVIFERNSLVV